MSTPTSDLFEFFRWWLFRRAFRSESDEYWAKWRASELIRLQKTVAYQQRILENSHQNNEVLRAEITRLTNADRVR